ncbi:CtsR family transcriptional regulator [Clostridium sartagoforme]|uniref:Transcriptional regulator CtsR n=1 Tax=Clostridium sartagoforme TaxID=84031 RepID=A0A4S2DD58_9CLOT|nr:MULTISPECIES: CtsR family transcriptional regulator [Clostridium]MBS5939982.1 CtsR family transcriptional regulator [Clostridium sp.]TGY39848.1 CtsR family transcriptional regulator [Clostridium sartagoforme]
MARISDTIENFINDMLNEEKERQVLIQRNELADKFSCAPSQINYVLTTRFTYEKGYIIESKRGGGGCIVIRKITYDDKDERLSLILSSIGESITYGNALSILDHLKDTKTITNSEYEIIKITLNDRTLTSVEDKNKLRSDMLKGILTVILS